MQLDIDNPPKYTQIASGSTCQYISNRKGSLQDTHIVPAFDIILLDIQDTLGRPIIQHNCLLKPRFQFLAILKINHEYHIFPWLHIHDCETLYLAMMHDLILRDCRQLVSNFKATASYLEEHTHIAWIHIHDAL